MIREYWNTLLRETHNAVVHKEYHCIFNSIRRSFVRPLTRLERCRDFHLYWKLDDTWHVFHVRPPYIGNHTPTISIIQEIHKEDPHANINLYHVSDPTGIKYHFLEHKTTVSPCKEKDKACIVLLHWIFEDIWNHALLDGCLVSDKYHVIKDNSLAH